MVTSNSQERQRVYGLVATEHPRDRNHGRRNNDPPHLVVVAGAAAIPATEKLRVKTCAGIFPFIKGI
jgi:hypothetical protein